MIVFLFWSSDDPIWKDSWINTTSYETHILPPSSTTSQSTFFGQLHKVQFCFKALKYGRCFNDFNWNRAPGMAAAEQNSLGVKSLRNSSTEGPSTGACLWKAKVSPRPLHNVNLTFLHQSFVHRAQTGYSRKIIPVQTQETICVSPSHGHCRANT